MSIQLKAQRIRFACDASKPFNAVADALTGAAISLPSGSALQLELLFYFNALADANLLDLSIYSGITIALQDNADPHSGTIYYSGTVAAANFQTSTTAQWTAATNQQLKLNITSAQNIVPPAATNYWIVVYGTVTSTGDYCLLFAANITGKDSGVPQSAAILPITFQAGNKLSFLCGDAQTRDVTLGQVGSAWVTQVNQTGYNGLGQAAYSIYCADAQWRDLTLVLTDGSYVLTVNQNGHS